MQMAQQPAVNATVGPTGRSRCAGKTGEQRVASPFGDTERVGVVERKIRDRAAETLAEIAHLDVRPMFSGFGFYLDGILVAAAWEGAFRLRYREGGRWIYRAVDESAIDGPEMLVPLVRQRAQALGAEPDARLGGSPVRRNRRT